MNENTKKSFLMGEGRKRRPRLKTPALLLLLLLPLLAALIYFSLFRAERQVEIPWKAFEIADLREDRVAAAGGTESAYRRFLSLFLQKGKAGVSKQEAMWLLPELREEHEIPGDRSTSLVFRAQENLFERDDQLLLGSLYAARADRSAFFQWRTALKESYPEYLYSEGEGENRAFALTYIRVLMEAYQVFGAKELLQEIRELAEALRNEFEQGLTADSRIRVVDPLPVDVGLIDQTGKSIEKSLDIEIVRLDTLDPALLRALAELDPAWQPLASRWIEILQKARLSNGFYAYGYDREGHYVSTDGESYLNPTAATARQIRHLCELEATAETSDSISLYLSFLQRDRTLRERYHLISLTAGSERTELGACAELYRASRLSGEEIAADLFNSSLDPYRYKGTVEKAKGLLFYRKGDEVILPMRENALALLSGIRLSEN